MGGNRRVRGPRSSSGRRLDRVRRTDTSPNAGGSPFRWSSGADHGRGPATTARTDLGRRPTSCRRADALWSGGNSCVVRSITLQPRSSPASSHRRERGYAKACAPGATRMAAIERDSDARAQLNGRMTSLRRSSRSPTRRCRRSTQATTKALVRLSPPPRSEVARPSSGPADGEDDGDDEQPDDAAKQWTDHRPRAGGHRCADRPFPDRRWSRSKTRPPPAPGEQCWCTGGADCQPPATMALCGARGDLQRSRCPRRDHEPLLPTIDGETGSRRLPSSSPTQPALKFSWMTRIASDGVCTRTRRAVAFQYSTVASPPGCGAASWPSLSVTDTGCAQVVAANLTRCAPAPNDIVEAAHGVARTGAPASTSSRPAATPSTALSSVDQHRQAGVTTELDVLRHHVVRRHRRIEADLADPGRDRPSAAVDGGDRLAAFRSTIVISTESVSAGHEKRMRPSAGT